MHSLLKDARILVAEDNVIIALDLVAELEDSGARVIGPTARVSDGLALLEGATPDGAILDVDLLDGPVTALAEQLLARQVPCVFCTGVGLPASLTARHPGLTVCSKPCQPERLAQRLTELMEEEQPGWASPGSARHAGN